MPEDTEETPLLFRGPKVTTDGTTATLTGPREEVLELLSYGNDDRSLFEIWRGRSLRAKPGDPPVKSWELCDSICTADIGAAIARAATYYEAEATLEIRSALLPTIRIEDSVPPEPRPGKPPAPRIGTDRLGDVVRRYCGQLRSIHAAGLGDTRLEAFEVIVRTLHAESLFVELYDAEIGLQLWDPARHTPVGWIIPSPYRDGTEPVG